MAVTFAIDISHHQSLSLDLAAARRDGAELCIVKGGEGSSFVDPTFRPNLDEAGAAGQLRAAYWYQRSGATPAEHVAKVRSVVPLDVAVIPDVETGSGGVPQLREFVNRLRDAGYRVPWTYLPKWYWEGLGSPSLVGLPDLWSSRYPDMVVGTLASEWAQVPASYWNGYGGLPVSLLQFTSSARIAGYQPLDASAFRGTREELAAKLGQVVSPGGGGGAPGPIPAAEGELMERITVTPPDGNAHTVRVRLSGTASAAVIVRPPLKGDGTSDPMWVGNIFAWGSDKTGVGGNPKSAAGYNDRMDQGPRRFALPGAVWADIQYSAQPTLPFDVDCY